MRLRRYFKVWLARTSLRKQLEFTATVIALLVGGLSVIALVYGEYRSGRAALLSDLRIQGEIISANSSAAAAFEDAELADEVLAALRSSRDIIHARLVLTDGRTLAEYSAEAAEESASASIWAQHIEISETVSYRGQGYGRLVMTGDFSRLNRRLAFFMMAAAGVLLLSVLLLGAAFKSAMTVLMQPVSELTGLMHKVSAEGNYSLRSELDARNELGDIANSFNQMLEQIENRDTALARELEERRLTEIRLAYLANHDPLTGLGNRNAFMNLVTLTGPGSTGEALPLCLLLLDVDHFKLVNDSLGHHAGDSLLVEIASRLKIFQDKNVAVFRLGGDEFAIVLSGHGDPLSAQRLADRVTVAMSTPFRILEQELFTSFSVGIALCPEHAHSMELLLNYADLALYESKNLGRDRWSLFSPHLKARINRRLRLEADLRRALEHDEFFLVYEPQVILSSGVPVGVEALVRWRHPELGLMSPADFIPLAEESGLIIKLGEWVLRRACLEGAAIGSQFASTPWRLAVNLSARQLADPAIVSTVARVLTESGFPADCLELEVTESIMIEKLDLVSERMRAIAALGVAFAMDDFGVGASSLSYLRRLPLAKIKIDRSFVRELPQNEDDAAVAAAIIALGQRIGIPVLAEGIETAAQLSCLQSMGCNLAQGYLFSRPKPLNEFIAYLSALSGHAAPHTSLPVSLARPH